VDKRGRYDFGSVAARGAARGAGLAAAAAAGIAAAIAAATAANGDAKVIRIKVECTF
jgi:hypothetical protein